MAWAMMVVGFDASHAAVALEEAGQAPLDSPAPDDPPLPGTDQDASVPPTEGSVYFYDSANPGWAYCANPADDSNWVRLDLRPLGCSSRLMTHSNARSTCRTPRPPVMPTGTATTPTGSPSGTAGRHSLQVAGRNPCSGRLPARPAHPPTCGRCREIGRTNRNAGHAIRDPAHPNARAALSNRDVRAVAHQVIDYDHLPHRRPRQRRPSGRRPPQPQSLLRQPQTDDHSRPKDRSPSIHRSRIAKVRLAPVRRGVVPALTDPVRAVRVRGHLRSCRCSVAPAATVWPQGRRAKRSARPRLNPGSSGETSASDFEQGSFQRKSSLAAALELVER